MTDTHPFVLLGAGASVPADIPTATAMSEKMLQSEPFLSSPLPSLGEQELQIIRFVAGGLAMHQGIEGQDPLSGINIEDLFAGVQALSKKEELTINPFVSQWHSAIERIDEKIKMNRPFRKTDLENAIEEALLAADPSSHSKYYYDSLQEHAQNIRREIDKYFFGEGSLWYEDAFVEAEKSMINSLINMVWLEDAEKADHLDPLLQTALEDKLPIVTLNYDNTVEITAERLGMDVKLGLQDWSQDGYISQPSQGVELLKLHGSMDWVKESPSKSQEVEETPLFPTQTVRKLDVDESPEQIRNPAIIFGTGNKLTEEGPFLELFRTFRRRLAEYRKLVTIGYSFTDEHINHVIYKWLNQSTNRSMIVIDREEIDEKDHSLWQENWQLHDSDRVELHAAGAEQGIRDLFGD